MAEGDETIPPASGEVDTPMRVVVCSTRARLVGEGDAVVALDVAELLMAIDEPRRVTVVVDTPFTPIELGFIARLARDFPPNVALLVQGAPHEDRRAFHDRGVYRAQFEPSDEGAIVDGSTIARTELIQAVKRKLERQPTPLFSLKKR